MKSFISLLSSLSSPFSSFPSAPRADKPRRRLASVAPPEPEAGAEDLPGIDTHRGFMGLLRRASEFVFGAADAGPSGAALPAGDFRPGVSPSFAGFAPSADAPEDDDDEGAEDEAGDDLEDDLVVDAEPGAEAFRESSLLISGRARLVDVEKQQAVWRRKRAIAQTMGLPTAALDTGMAQMATGAAQLAEVVGRLAVVERQVWENEATIRSQEWQLNQWKAKIARVEGKFALVAKAGQKGADVKPWAKAIFWNCVVAGVSEQIRSVGHPSNMLPGPGASAAREYPVSSAR